GARQVERVVAGVLVVDLNRTQQRVLRLLIFPAGAQDMRHVVPRASDERRIRAETSDLDLEQLALQLDRLVPLVLSTQTLRPRGGFCVRRRHAAGVKRGVYVACYSPWTASCSGARERGGSRSARTCSPIR